MLIITKNLSPKSNFILNCVRSCTTKANSHAKAFDSTLKDNFSPQDYAKILETLNESRPEDLSRFKISDMKIRSMCEWKKKKGHFKSLSEVLEVEGFGEKILEQICKKIAYNNISATKYKTNKKNRFGKNFLLPEMDYQLSDSLQSAVAIHVEATGIGWARITKTGNTITNWKCQNFSSLPTKMLPTDTFDLAVNLLKETPSADAYIIEAPPNVGPLSSTQVGTVSTRNHQVELISMLLALLNTSAKHNNSLEKSLENKVFFLRGRIPARLFSTLIGYEKVSGISLITDIVNNDSKVINSLPCTPINFDPELNHNFLNEDSLNKLLLAQALMLGASFMDLCIHRNSKCFEALQPRNAKK